jgi:DNA-binding NtrC family response regulator
MVAKPHILVVDDEQVVRESLHAWFAQDGYPVEMAASASEALEKLKESSWDIVVTDIKMPGMDGLELQQKVKELDPDIAIIFMTAYASVDTAVQAIKEGAYDYVTKPLDPDNLEQIVNRAAERQRLVRENVQLRERIEAVSGEADEIIGESLAIRRARELVQSVAATDTFVLVTGDSGTGKELVARTIHNTSHRRHMPLMTVNCAGRSENEIQVDLFGHEKDAVPDAPFRRRGRIELSNGGTLFFDEIGEIGPKVQIDILRALKEKNITRVGGSGPFPVDFRGIAASGHDLAQAADRGDFRQDLYAQINACVIALPPLRERPEDIAPLARYFLQKSARDVDGRVRSVSEEALGRLAEYGWPGNVRELKNVIERAVVLQQGDVIEPRDLPLAPPAEATASMSLAAVEKQHILNVLAKVSGDLTKAAQALQVDEATLKQRIRAHGISV